MTGLPLINNFGKVVGGLLFVSSREEIDAASWQMFGDIVRGCAVMALAAGFVALIAVVAVFASTRASLKRAATAVASLTPQSMEPFTPDPASDLEQMIDRLRDRIAAGWVAVDDANRRMDELGR